MTSGASRSSRDTASGEILLATLCGRLAEIAPLDEAESWDNVGLLIGDRQRRVRRVMTCLTVTPAVVDEACAERVDLLIAHHPLPFKPLSRITADTVTGGLLLRLIEARVAVYSAHTAFDSAREGINQQWADQLGVGETRPLVEPVGDEQGKDPSGRGAGRYGRLPQPMSLDELIRLAAASVGAVLPRRVGPADQSVTKVGFACGSGASFIAAARRRGCDALLTGEASFHACLEAEALQIGLGLLGHYCSERFAMERLAERLSAELPALEVWGSRCESDPIQPLAG